MIKMFKKLKGTDYALLFLSLVFVILQVWLDLKLPDYMSEITVLVQTPGSEMGDVINAGVKMLACAFGSLFGAFVVGFFISRIAASLAKQLREDVYTKTMSFTMEEINNFSTPSLITRSTNDITQVQMFMAMGLQMLMKAPLTAIYGVIKIADKSWQWTSITAGAVVLILILILIVIVVALPKFKIIQTLTDNLNRVSRENLTGIRVVRAYNAEAFEERKFDKANNELTQTNLFVNRTMATLMPFMTLIMSSLSLFIYWVGVYIIEDAQAMEKLNLFSDLVVFTQYAMQIIMSFMMLTVIFIIFPRASVSAKRINEILDTDIKIKDGSNNGDTKIKGSVEFKNVSFKYPDAADYVLENISFCANPGETVAFIGATGSGKSSLINLIPRFYDVTSGEVLVDGINVKNYTQEALRNKLGYVPQKTVMFSGTVSSNVSYGDNGMPSPSIEQIKKAVSIAQGEEFVSKMTDTYDASIAQGGTNISGGQKQRLSIARAICRNPEIFIFDDSFSALDYKTDRVLRTALKQETNGSTNIIVAQRIGTIMDADKIIVLDEGKMVGMGTHKELLNNCQVYREIAESQLSKEEIENAG